MSRRKKQRPLPEVRHEPEPKLEPLSHDQKTRVFGQARRYLAHSNDGERPLSIEAAAFSFSGPIPPPQTLAQYESAIPGAGDRIILMAEQQAGHRQDREREESQASISLSNRGLNFAFIVTMTIILGGLGLVASGKELYGLATPATAIATCAGIFVYGKHADKQIAQRHRPHQPHPPKDDHGAQEQA